MSTIIQVDKIAKKYKLKHRIHESVTLREQISNLFTNREKNISFNNSKDFWVLKDISFEMNQGEVLGIIGGNGAGKSTLLKILSRITTPTFGKAILNGRVGSLLEVGTGFHPELSGRENIYFNGIILGLTKQEIKTRFDEIVDFSGIEQFIDTPIKRYSSGMKMRLAFSVAAHLNPEILIIDEVLAVGDFNFQQKCINKMQDSSRSGRTILFVSHNASSIRQLCTRCILLKNGIVKEDSKDIAYVMNQYFEIDNAEYQYVWNNSKQQLDFEELTPLQLRLTDNNQNTIKRPIISEEEVFIEIQCDVKTRNPNIAIGYAIYDSSKTMIYYSYHSDLYEGTKLGIGKKILSSKLPANIFNDGEYTVQLIAGVMHHHPLLTCEDSPIQIKLKIEGSALRSSLWIGTRQSTLAPVLQWSCFDGL